MNLTHLLLQLQAKTISTTPLFTQQNTLENKTNYQGEMLIVQIIEFELRGPQSCTCTPKTGHFYGKTEISLDKFSIEL